MKTESTNTLAYLAREIIFVILEIGPPNAKDLTNLHKIKGNWGKTVRSGKLQKFAHDIDKRITHSYNFNSAKSVKWNVVDSYIVPGRLPLEDENRVLRDFFQSVWVELSYCCVARANAVLELLRTRPLAKLSVDLPPANNTLVEPLLELFKKPLFRSFSANVNSELPKELVDMLASFIKNSNFHALFLCQRHNSVVNYPAMFLKCLMERTSLLNRLQCVQLECTVVEEQFEFFNLHVVDLGFQLAQSKQITAARLKADCNLYYMDHPADATKRIEVLLHPRFVEFCLTSKEATVCDEFGEYAISLICEHFH